MLKFPVTLKVIIVCSVFSDMLLPCLEWLRAQEVATSVRDIKLSDWQLTGFAALRTPRELSSLMTITATKILVI